MSPCADDHFPSSELFPCPCSAYAGPDVLPLPLTKLIHNVEYIRTSLAQMMVNPEMVERESVMRGLSKVLSFDLIKRVPVEEMRVSVSPLR